jgi:hypothetical protein
MSGQDPAIRLVATRRSKRGGFVERLEETRRLRLGAPGRQEARTVGAPRADRRPALPAQNGHMDQLRTVMQEMSERFSVRHTASA